MIGFMLRLSCIVVSGDVTCWNNTTGLSLRPIYAMTCGLLSLVAYVVPIFRLELNPSMLQ